tara:strand:+ start:43 stop:4602 length:4560 start_codon:yes stop_codon:yes gene_type:complete
MELNNTIFYHIIDYRKKIFISSFFISVIFLIWGCSTGLESASKSGNEKSQQEWYEKMNYGPYLTATYEVSPENFAYKGIAIRLDKGEGGLVKGNTFIVYDTDLLRTAGAWTGEGFVNWTNIAFDGSHTTHMSPVGDLMFTTPKAPGWANSNNSFDDPRMLGLDKKPYGPLPRNWAHWKGLYVNEDKVILSYTVGETKVLEMPSLEQIGKHSAIVRTLNISPSSSDLVLELASSDSGIVEEFSLGSGKGSNFGGESLISLKDPDKKTSLSIAYLANVDGVQWALEGLHVRIKIPASSQRTDIKVIFIKAADSEIKKLASSNFELSDPFDLSNFTNGGPASWDQELTTVAKLGSDDVPVTWDYITAPMNNPWNSYLRFGGFDYFKDPSKAAVCTWQGDVWIVEGLGNSLGNLKWKRIATGLFQPLGVKVIDEDIYVTCRDQITILRDLNNDGETDFYENFNNDHQVTEHFHEFAMDLQVDDDGNLYYAKGARHAKEALVPQHGTIIRVSKDGEESEIVASGFRAPNGVLLNDDGSFISSDQEGHWNPKNKINWIKRYGFYGAMGAYHSPDQKASDFELPICWIHNKVDRSPSEQLWVKNENWGPLYGSLLSLSYGYGKVFNVLYEDVGDIKQGGIVQVPMEEFPTGVMRGRFHPKDNGLYVCGLFAWSSNKTFPGGFYRIRTTEKPLHIATKINAVETGVLITFSYPLDRETAVNPQSYNIERWNYRRTPNYGSQDYRVSDGRKGHDKLYATEVLLSDDSKSVFLKIPDMRPAMQMEIKYNIKSQDGEWISQFIHHTIHVLGDPNKLSSRGFKTENLVSIPEVPSSNQLGRNENEYRENGLEPGLGLIINSQKQGDRTIDVRKSRLAALHVPINESPSPFIKNERFNLTWEGYLNSDFAREVVFESESQGFLNIWINGLEVLASWPYKDNGYKNLIRTRSDPVNLVSGLNTIQIVLKSPEETNWKGTPNDPTDITLRLFWESDAFPLEPIPPSSLWFNPTTVGLDRYSNQHKGRELFASNNCIKCHLPSEKKLLSQAMAELSWGAPSFTNIGSRLNGNWISKWISNPKDLRSDASMPIIIGDGSADDINHISAFLVSLSDSEGTLSNTIRGDPSRGESIFSALGCIGCHAKPGEKENDNFNRISLDYVHSKWKPNALKDFIQNPSRYHNTTKMPNFRVSEEQAHDLASYIISSDQVSLTTDLNYEKGNIEKGKELVSSSGCINCHELSSNPRITFSAPSLETIERGNWDNGCLSPDEKNTGKAPRFNFSLEDREALKSFARSGIKSIFQQTSSLAALRQIESLKCTGCHSFDSIEDTWSLISANSKEIVSNDDLAHALGLDLIWDYQGRPDLTWVGGKLKADWMNDFISGDISKKPRGGLIARMPGFSYHSKIITDGLAMLHGINPKSTVEASKRGPSIAETGKALVQTNGGFACITCHGVGEKRATGGVPIESINFSIVTKRLKKDYYHRFLNNPQRIIEDTMMPRYADDAGKTFLTNYYDGDSKKQFDAMWEYFESIKE